jgi:hypothetical protein
VLSEVRFRLVKIPLERGSHSIHIASGKPSGGAGVREW